MAGPAVPNIEYHNCMSTWELTLAPDAPGVLSGTTPRFKEEDIIFTVRLTFIYYGVKHKFPNYLEDKIGYQRF